MVSDNLFLFSSCGNDDISKLENSFASLLLLRAAPFYKTPGRKYNGGKRKR